MSTTLGKYEVLFPLSMPGSEVEAYLATQKGFGGFRKLVILRQVLKELKGDEAAHQQFMKEVKTVAAFHHPNVAEVYDLEAADGKLLLATEFVPGATLEEISQAFRTSKLRMPLGFVLTALRDAALALQYAHTFTNPLGEPEPVAHGSLSGRTIQLTFEGLTKVIAFGAPRPGASGAPSAANDLAALGTLAPATLAEQANDLQLSSRPDVTPEIRSALARLIAADPAQRFQHASDFVKALEAAASPVLWKPEQSAALVQRMFGERREEIRQLLTQLKDTGTSTAVMPLSKIFSEGRAPSDAETGPRPAASDEPPWSDDASVVDPLDQTNPAVMGPASGGQPLWQVQTVIRPSGERPGPTEEPPADDPPPSAAEREPSTDVRPLPRAHDLEAAPARRGGGSTLLRLLMLVVVLGMGLLVFKWRIDPAWVRARNPKAANALEKLSFIPGFPGPEVPRDEQEVLALIDAGRPESDGGAADAGNPVDAADAGHGKSDKRGPHHHPR